MKKYILDLTVASVQQLSDKHVLLRLTQREPLPDMLPGQFVEVRVDASPTTFLRRPISINFVDRTNNELWLMVAMVGEGTDYADMTVNLDNNFGLQEYGIAFRKGSDVTEKVNQAIIELTKDCTVAEIAGRYGLTDALVPVE